MDFELDASHHSYIKINVRGMVEKPGFISAISQLMSHPDYLNKHSYWDFTQANMGLTISDLKEIAGVLKLYKPEQKEFANRSALLVHGKLISAMAQMFVSMSNQLSFKYRVFTDPKDAETYLCS